MTDKLQHQGIAIKLDHLSERRWRWEISSPTSVSSLQEQVDEVFGDQGDAVRAAWSAIESQSSSARLQ